MVTALIAIGIAVLAADLIYSRVGLALRRLAQPQKPAWNVIRRPNEGWRPLFVVERQGDADTESNDLGSLFGRRRR
jgi:hypothetical protein